MWSCKKCQARHEDNQEICWNCGTSKDGIEDPNFVREHESGADGASDQQDEARQPVSLDQLIFVGLSGYALALDRDSGEVVWSNNQMKSGYVSLLLDGDRLIVSTNGYMYCLNPLTGDILWHNPLTGYGTAPASVISVRGQSSQAQIQQTAEVIRQQHQHQTSSS